MSLTEDQIMSATFEGALNAYAHAVHATAVDHGWWPDTEQRSMGELIALMHSELSEALESWRDSEPMLWYDYDGMQHTDNVRNGTLGKPCGIASEFADVIIRILDTCEQLNIPIARALLDKHHYNITRPYRHGGKRA